MAGTTMRDIAGECGLSRRTLYRHYPSLDRIAVEIYMDLFASPDFFSNRHRVNGRNGYDRLLDACNAFCAYCIENEDVIKFFFEYDYHFRGADQEEVHEYWQERPGYFESLVREGMKDGSISIGGKDPNVVGITLVSAILATAQRIILRKDVYSVEHGYTGKDLFVLVDLLLDGIKAPGGG
jgi:AcrR family transcriptional regulator